MFFKFTVPFILASFAILAVATPAPNNKPSSSAPSAPSARSASSAPTTPSAPATSSAPATPSSPAGSGGAGSCSTGELQCCSSVESANSTAVSGLLAALGVVLQDLNIPIGLSCSAITGVGVGTGDACSANTVCCDNNNLGGLIAIGCLPADL